MFASIQEIYPDYARPEIDTSKSEITFAVPSYITVSQDSPGCFLASVFVCDKKVAQGAHSLTAAEALTSLREEPRPV